MHPATDWLDRTFARGESVLNQLPVLAADRAAVVACLRRAFDRHALDVAGPTLPFDPDAAFAGAEVLAVACWRQASGAAGPPLAAPEPGGPAAHLSADVTLRLLPGVYRRAVASGTSLAADLAAVLRRWPLAGVLADLDGAPATRPDFGGHRGLQLLYAERLAIAPRAGWVPPPGPAREAAERVFAGRKLTLPDPIPDVPPDA